MLPSAVSQRQTSEKHYVVIATIVYNPEGSATISPTVKNVDVAGAGTEQFEIALAFGPVIA